MKFSTYSAAFLFTSFALALPQLLDIGPLLNTVLQDTGLDSLVGNGALPAAIATTIHSPQCANVNGGTYACCQSTFDGDLPLVVALSAATDYPLTDNSINGFVCKFASLLSLSSTDELRDRRAGLRHLQWCRALLWSYYFGELSLTSIVLSQITNRICC